VFAPPKRGREDRKGGREGGTEGPPTYLEGVGHGVGDGRELGERQKRELIVDVEIEAREDGELHQILELAGGLGREGGRRDEC